MAKEISIIRQEAQQVQNATQVGENTAQRVGGVLVDIVDKAEEHETDIDNLTANTGVDDYPVFSTSEAYPKGKVVNYNGKLYKFTADHAAGAWIGTDVEKTSMADNSKTAKVKLEDLDTLFTGSQSAGTLSTAMEIMTGLVPTVYDVMGSQNVILGKLFAYSDSMRHVITQVLFTSMTLDDNGALIGSHVDGITHMYYRTYGVMAPSLANGKWTEWKQIVTELVGGTYMQTLEPDDTPITSLNNFNRCENHFYFASTPGTYTKAGNIVVDNGELALISWNWRTKAFSKKTIYKTNIVQKTGTSENAVMSQKAVSTALGIKTVVFPQASMVNLDLNNDKVIIKAGQLYVTYFNSNQYIHTIEAQEIDIADKLSANSALIYNITDMEFKFLSLTEQDANIKIDDAIVVLLNARKIYYQSCDIYINGVLNGVLDAKEKAYNLSNNINGVYPTLNHLAATDISLDFNGTTGHYTYKAYNVLWGKGSHAQYVPAGEGDYLARKNTENVVPMGFNGIFFNTSTKQLVWCEFDRFADYSDKDWVVLNFFVSSSVIPLFDNGMQVTKDGERTDFKGSLSQSIKNLSADLGLKLGNFIPASDLFMGYDDGIFNTTVPGDVPNTTIERVFSEELGKYVLRAEISPETSIPSGYKRTDIFMLNESFPEGTELYFSALFRLQTSNAISARYPSLIPLINGTWVDRYIGGSWEPFYSPSFTDNYNDGKWHRFSFKIRATNGGAINKVGLSIFYCSELDYINGGCVLDLTDLYVGKVDPGYSTVYNEDDLSRPAADLSGLVDNNAKGCVFMSLGDSITTEGYYIEKLRQLLKPSRFFNLAVAGATWADKSGTSSYDGNPLFQGDANQNVMGNQVQKIIDNPETYNVDPDIIIMAAGTNDSRPVSTDKSDYEMRVEIDSHFNSDRSTPIQVTDPTFDDADTFKEHRKTVAGAMRYCVLKLQQMYPKSRIYILTPIQGSYNPNKDYLTDIEVKQRYITEVAKHLAMPVIHVGEECGINRDFEYGGTYWKSEYDPQNRKEGRDLVDGLHPNPNGGWKMANYIYRKIIEDYIPQYYNIDL